MPRRSFEFLLRAKDVAEWHKHAPFRFEGQRLLASATRLARLFRLAIAGSCRRTPEGTDGRGERLLQGADDGSAKLPWRVVAASTGRTATTGTG